MNQIQRKNKVVDEFELETPAVAAPSNSGSADAGPVNSDIEVERLAGLSPIEYERQREEVAKRLGVRLQTLDRMVQHARERAAANPENLVLPEIASAPWPEQVAGAVLLDEMTAAIRQYVTLEKGAVEATALWTVHTHALDAFAISPRLAITSPVMKCGKTTLLDVVACLVLRPMTTVNTTPAAIYRLVDRKAPTLPIDEAGSASGAWRHGSQPIISIALRNADLNAFSCRIARLSGRSARGGICAHRGGAIDPSATPLQPVELVLRDRIRDVAT